MEFSGWWFLLRDFFVGRSLMRKVLSFEASPPGSGLGTLGRIGEDCMDPEEVCSHYPIAGGRKWE